MKLSESDGDLVGRDRDSPLNKKSSLLCYIPIQMSLRMPLSKGQYL